MLNVNASANAKKNGVNFAGEMLIIILAIMIVLLDAYRASNRGVRLVIRGELTQQNVSQIQTVIDTQESGFSTLVFVDSPGAGAAAGMLVAQIEAMIMRHHFHTEARGMCSSACAVAFLYGESRTLLVSENGAPTYLLLHAIRSNVTHEVDYGKTEEINEKIIAKSHGKFPLALLNRIFDDQKGNGDGEVFIYRDAQITALGRHHVFVCDTANRNVTQECEAIPGLTPEKLGIRVAN
jgi:hypothetical protein